VPVRLTLYNHKGGVGKTTLTINIAGALARAGKRVLLIDSDPQCNLTAYLLADNVVNDLLDNSDSDDGRTLWSALRPVFNGEGGPISVQPIETVVENLFLLPGDIKLSEFEQFLGDAWTDSFKRRLLALKATGAISRLAGLLAESMNIDFVFYDTGPNIGPLNRVILLDSDNFVVPVACDLFSERALATLGNALSNWIIDWRTISAMAPDDAYLLKGRPRFIGYIPQRFRVYGQQMAQEPQYYLRRIERRIFSDLVSVLRKVDPKLASGGSLQWKLGEIKEFGGIIQKAQTRGVPLADAVGASVQHRDEARAAFKAIADQVVRRSLANAHTVKRRLGP
jgi:cellulose biosynthesis protein BcsQ